MRSDTGGRPASLAPERPLELERRVGATVGTVEGGEKAVLLVADDRAVVRGEQALDEHVMIGEELLPAFGPEFGGERLRVGDVAQHQRDGAVWR